MYEFQKTFLYQNKLTFNFYFPLTLRSTLVHIQENTKIFNHYRNATKMNVKLEVLI